MEFVLAVREKLHADRSSIGLVQFEQEDPLQD